MKAGILPVGFHAYLVNRHGTVSCTHRYIEKAMVDEDLQVLSRMNIGSGSVRTGTQNFERMDVEQWVNIESDEVVLEASGNDAMDVLGRFRW